MIKKNKQAYRNTINVKNIYMLSYPYKKQFGDSRDTRWPIYYVKKKEVSEHEYAITVDEYAHIITTFFHVVSDFIIKEGGKFVAPFGMFTSQIVRRYFKNSYVPKEPLKEVAFMKTKLGKSLFCKEAYTIRNSPKVNEKLRLYILSNRNNLYKYNEI